MLSVSGQPDDNLDKTRASVFGKLRMRLNNQLSYKLELKEWDLSSHLTLGKNMNT